MYALNWNAHDSFWPRIRLIACCQARTYSIRFRPKRNREIQMLRTDSDSNNNKKIENLLTNRLDCNVISNDFWYFSDSDIVHQQQHMNARLFVYQTQLLFQCSTGRYLSYPIKMQMNVRASQIFFKCFQYIWSAAKLRFSFEWKKNNKTISFGQSIYRLYQNNQIINYVRVSTKIL